MLVYVYIWNWFWSSFHILWRFYNSDHFHSLYVLFLSSFLLLISSLSVGLDILFGGDFQGVEILKVWVSDGFLYDARPCIPYLFKPSMVMICREFVPPNWLKIILDEDDTDFHVFLLDGWNMTERYLSRNFGVLLCPVCIRSRYNLFIKVVENLNRFLHS